MNMLRFSLSILAISGLVCLNLSQAQTFNIPTNTGTPPISITPNTPSTTPGLSAPASSDATRAKKYYEFKSICVRDEQAPIILSANVKEKRLALIQTKLEKAQSAKNKELIQQIKALQIREYFKQENYVKADELFLRESINLTETDRILIATDIDLRKQLPKLAKNNLNKYLETHRSDVLVLEKLAEVYIILGYHTDAVMAYEDLQKMNPKKSYIESLCQASTFNNDHSNIALYCRQLQKKEPDNSLADIYLGISYRDQEKYKDAIKSFEKSMKIKPTEFASSCLAESYYLNKEFEKAITQFEASVKISPTSPRARLGLANTYLKQNLFKEALEQFKESCKMGLKPLIEMSAAANSLRTQKSDLANLYFDEMQKCKK